MIPRLRCGRRRAARTLGVALLGAGLLLGLLSSLAVAQDGTGALVEVVEIEGIVDTTVAGYVTETIEQAAADGAEVVVISLDTPGGLRVSPQELTTTITQSPVPVVVWVGPSGARATGLGMYMAYAAHVLGMAPSTTLGDATHVDLRSRSSEPSPAAEAELVALAELRGRDVEFAAAAARDGAVVAIGEAAELPQDAKLPSGIERDDVTVVGPDELEQRPVADLVAGSLPDLLSVLDGREVQIRSADGTTTAQTLQIDQATASVRFNNLGLWRRILHTVSNPTLAYLLLIGGALTLLFEVFQPGFGVAGVTGLVLIALAVYGLAVLPVNWFAFALIVVGLALLAVDLAIAGLGLLTAGGTVALAVGSLLLFNGADALDVSPWLVGGIVVFTVIFFVIIMTTVLRAQSSQAMLGAEGMEGKVGVVRSMLNPEGHIFVDGALWRARAPEAAGKVKTGTQVRILGINDRLTLDVEVIEAAEGADTHTSVS